MTYCKFKKKMTLESDDIHFFHALIHVNSHGTGADSPQGKIYVNRNTSSLYSFVASLKQSFRSLILYIFPIIQYMYIAPGRRAYSPKEQSFGVNRNFLSLR